MVVRDIITVCVATTYVYDIDEIGNSGLLQVCVKDGQYSLNLHGNHYDESSRWPFHCTSVI